MSEQETKKVVHIFKCVKGVVGYFDETRKDGNMLSFKNEKWKLLEKTDTGCFMECTSGPNEGWEIEFTFEQMAENFEWDKTMGTI